MHRVGRVKPIMLILFIFNFRDYCTEYATQFRESPKENVSIYYSFFTVILDLRKIFLCKAFLLYSAKI